MPELGTYVDSSGRRRSFRFTPRTDRSARQSASLLNALRRSFPGFGPNLTDDQVQRAVDVAVDRLPSRFRRHVSTVVSGGAIIWFGYQYFLGKGATADRARRYALIVWKSLVDRIAGAVRALEPELRRLNRKLSDRIDALNVVHDPVVKALDDPQAAPIPRSLNPRGRFPKPVHYTPPVTPAVAVVPPAVMTTSSTSIFSGFAKGFAQAVDKGGDIVGYIVTSATDLFVDAVTSVTFEETSDPVISKMISGTAYPSTVGTVDFGTTHIKGLPSRRSFDKERLGEKFHFAKSWQDIYDSSSNHKQYHILNYFRAPLKASNHPDANDAICMIDMANYNDSTVAASADAGVRMMPSFNSVNFQELCAKFFYQPTSGAIGSEVHFDGNVIKHPIYDNTLAMSGVTSSGAPNAGILWDHQEVSFKIKNLTQSYSADVPVVYRAPTPAYIIVRIMKCLDDITCSFNDIKENTDVFDGEIIAPLEPLFTSGFSSKFRDTTNQYGVNKRIEADQLPNSLEQDPHITLYDNNTIGTFFAQVHSKKFVLAPGQEANMKFVMPARQFMSFAYRERAAPFVHQYKGANPSTSIYAPVYHRKGEMFFMLEMMGGLEGTTTASSKSPTEVTIAPAAVGVYVDQRCSGYFVVPESTGESYIDFKTEDTRAASTADPTANQL